MSEQEAYLERYTSELQPLLLQLAQQEGFLRGPLLETADLDELWPALAQPYMASAVPDFEQYPLVSLGWIRGIRAIKHPLRKRPLYPAYSVP